MKRWIPLMMLIVCSVAFADEGMWPPGQLPELAPELKRLGLRLDPRDLTDLTKHPMNAVISLGGCTASFVSPEGLVITNHHCAYGAIQYNSTEDSNLLADGFVASSRAEELFAGPGSRVLVTVEVQDVTDKVLGGLSAEQGGRERFQAIEDREKALVAACEEDEGHRCRVASYHGGLQYELIKQLEIRDVRLVYAPPGPVGKYGGDIDNWMWPRHTGDFSFYRAYVGKDGNPADPDEANVPFQPSHHLRVAAEGVGEGDFVMVAGYPGRTNRYRMAAEVDGVFSWSYPTRKDLFEEWIDVIETETAERPEAALKYASLLAGLNNATKNYGGMLEGFAKSDAVPRKQALEVTLQDWIGENPERQQLYGAALSGLEVLVAESQARRERDVYYGFLAQRSSLLGVAQTLYRLSREQEKPDAEREPGFQERDLIRIRERLTRLDRTFDADVDRAAWRHFIERYAAIPTDLHVEPFDEWFGIEGQTVDAMALDGRLDAMYADTELDDQEARLAWIDRARADLEKSTDPFIQLAVHLYDADMVIEEQEKDLAGRFQSARPRFMEALIAYLGSQGKAVYPDANSTLRVTVGTIKGSSPKDGLRYVPFTTLAGIIEKDTGEDPFDTPPGLLEAMRESRPGRWNDPRLGAVPVNFLSTVDTTGGNSGSPTLNARGELVGLLFDGTYESIISDWDFLPDKTRSIHVDIRYALWVMEHLGGADRLLGEMGVAERPGLSTGAAAGGR